MTKEEIMKEIDELGIIAIEDADSIGVIEDAIRAVKESINTPAFIAAPLVIDAETDRKLFNTKKKIFDYFTEKKLDDATALQVMQEVIKPEMTIYPTTVKTDREKLEWQVGLYLTYTWVEDRKAKNRRSGK